MYVFLLLFCSLDCKLIGSSLVNNLRPTVSLIRPWQCYLSKKNNETCLIRWYQFVVNMVELLSWCLWWYTNVLKMKEGILLQQNCVLNSSCSWYKIRRRKTEIDQKYFVFSWQETWTYDKLRQNSNCLQNEKINQSEKHVYGLCQWFLTGGRPTPGGRQ